MISTVAFSDPVKQLLPKLVRILDVLVTVGCMNCVWMRNLTKGGRGNQNLLYHIWKLLAELYVFLYESKSG